MSLLAHYSAIADQYERLFAWQNVAEENGGIFDIMIRLLDLNDEDIIADIGCGTGRTLRSLAEKLQPRATYIAVDPCPKFINLIERKDNFKTFSLDADKFADEEISYDVLILRNMVHHIGSREQIRSCFERFHRQLNTGGRILIMISPKGCFPIVSQDELVTSGRSKAVGALEGLEKILTNVGFDAERLTKTFTVEIKADEYRNMIRSRFVSALTNISDENIERMVSKVDDIERNGMVEWLHELDLYVLRKV